MKNGERLGLLVFFLICILAVHPVLADNATHQIDPATNYYNHGEYALQQNDYIDAISDYDLALGSNTTMIKISDALLYTYRDKSYAQMQLGNYSEALKTLDAGIALYPTDEFLWNNKGWAEYNLGNYTGALNSYNQALDIDANFTPSLVNKGDVLEKMGQHQAAVNAYNAAIVSDAGNNDDNSSIMAKLAVAQKEANASFQTTMIILGGIVVVAIAGVAFYVTRKPKATNEPATKQDKNTGSKKKRKK